MTMPTPDYLGADGGKFAAAFAAGCIAAWGFIKAFVMSPRIKALEKENERCNERLERLEWLLYQHGTGEIRALMQTMFSARDMEKRDPIAAAKLAPEVIRVPASKGDEE